MEKTAVFNLIILDESGSMYHAKEATIAGCNNALDICRSQQEKYNDKQRSFVSIYSFHSGSDTPSRYICKNADVLSTKNITKEDYQPDGCTPMLDAIGSTLIDLEAVASTHEDATAIVTIITDGMENDSKDYSWEQISTMISKFKELGWTFNFIGANIDVQKVSKQMNIDNAMSFDNTDKGTRDMFVSLNACTAAYNERRIVEEENMTLPERMERRKRASKGKFFDFD